MTGGEPGGKDTPTGALTEHDVLFDPNVYSLSAIKRATYRFTDRCAVRIDLDAKGYVRVRLSRLRDLTDMDRLVAELQNEVLDQELRETVAKETQGVRNLIIAHALSKTALLNEELEEGEYKNDPAFGRKT